MSQSAEDRLQNLEESLAKLLADASHRIRNHLTIIQSYLEIVHSDFTAGLSDEQLSFLGTAYDNVVRLRNLIEDLVLIGAVETGIVDLQMTSVAVGPFLHDLCATLEPRAEKERIDFQSTIGTDLGTVRADGDKLDNAIRRLVDNAFRFTPGGGSVTLRASADTTSVAISVVDSGVGMTDEGLATAFELMTQLHHKPGETREGHGLGLPVALRLVQAFGGNISAESTVGVGSTFTLRLPRETNAD